MMNLWLILLCTITVSRAQHQLTSWHSNLTVPLSLVTELAECQSVATGCIRTTCDHLATSGASLHHTCCHTAPLHDAWGCLTNLTTLPVVGPLATSLFGLCMASNVSMHCVADDRIFRLLHEQLIPAHEWLKRHVVELMHDVSAMPATQRRVDELEREVTGLTQAVTTCQTNHGRALAEIDFQRFQMIDLAAMVSVGQARSTALEAKLESVQSHATDQIAHLQAELRHTERDMYRQILATQRSAFTDVQATLLPWTDLIMSHMVGAVTAGSRLAVEAVDRGADLGTTAVERGGKLMQSGVETGVWAAYRWADYVLYVGGLFVLSTFLKLVVGPLVSHCTRRDPDSKPAPMSDTDLRIARGELGLPGSGLTRRSERLRSRR